MVNSHPAQLSNRLKACRAAIALSVPPNAPETLLAASRSSMEIWLARPAPTAFFAAIPSAVFLPFRRFRSGRYPAALRVIETCAGATVTPSSARIFTIALGRGFSPFALMIPATFRIRSALLEVASPRFLAEVTFPPFLDPSGMLGFFTLASPERVGFSDGKEAFQ
jgi:hypothetical protein